MKGQGKVSPAGLLSVLRFGGMAALLLPLPNPCPAPSSGCCSRGATCPLREGPFSAPDLKFGILHPVPTGVMCDKY